MNAKDSAAPELSFVIPARNEERHIGEVLDAVRACTPASLPYEIVVADHASTDATARLARERGARVVTVAGGTVAALRNAAAAQTSAPCLIFLDGDVLVTPSWGGRIAGVAARLRADPDMVTGSTCGVARRAGRIERLWFEPLQRRAARFINSGHLVTSRRLFERLGGFDARLETFEDVDFSRRAAALGARIVDDPQLPVHHEGFPHTIGQFFWRERWHGRGTFRSLGTVLSSRIAPLTILFVLLHLALLASLAAGALASALALAGAIAAICLASSLAKYGARPLRALAAAGLYYVYFSARALALFDVLAGSAGGAGAARRRHR